LCAFRSVQVGLETSGFLDWVEVLTLEVLDKGEFEHLVVGCIPNNDWDFGEARALGGPEPSLTGNDLKSVAASADDERLEHAVLEDRGLQVVEILRFHALAWLEWVGVEEGDGESGGRRLLYWRFGDRMAGCGLHDAVEASSEFLVRHVVCS
jgi:hypothetical protein